MKIPKIISKKCLECGVEFFKKSSESKKYWSTKKYCSQKCSIKNTSAKVLGVAKSFPKGHVPWNLNKTYSESQKQKLDLSGLALGRSKGIKRLGSQGKNNPLWKRIEVNCSYCNSKLLIQPNQQGKRNFCNRTCWALGTRGTGSPVYKGEKAVSRLRNRIAYLPEYRHWHASILKRDGYRCVLCQSKKDLEVDHIKRFLHIANEYEIRTPEDARNCIELWDINNGRTLCRICHHTTDTYGTTGLKKLY